MDLASIAAWCKEHKLRTIGGVWLGGVAGAFAWNSTRTHLSAAARVFHTRIYAQALTLGCLIGSAAAELYDAKYGAGGAGAGGELPPDHPPQSRGILHSRRSGVCLSICLLSVGLVCVCARAHGRV